MRRSPILDWTAVHPCSTLSFIISKQFKEMNFITHFSMFPLMRCSKNSTSKVITGYYIITLHSVFGYSIVVQHYLSFIYYELLVVYILGMKYTWLMYTDEFLWSDVWRSYIHSCNMHIHMHRHEWFAWYICPQPSDFGHTYQVTHSCMCYDNYLLLAVCTYVNDCIACIHICMYVYT